jgi:hypothetical protein
MDHTPPALRTHPTLEASDGVEGIGRVEEPAAVPKRGPVGAHTNLTVPERPVLLALAGSDGTRRPLTRQEVTTTSGGPPGALGGATARGVPRSRREAT